VVFSNLNSRALCKCNPRPSTGEEHKICSTQVKQNLLLTVSKNITWCRNQESSLWIRNRTWLGVLSADGRKWILELYSKTC